jgi:hypothetical protein
LDAIRQDEDARYQRKPKYIVTADDKVVTIPPQPSEAEAKDAARSAGDMLLGYQARSEKLQQELAERIVEIAATKAEGKSSRATERGIRALVAKLTRFSAKKTEVFETAVGNAETAIESLTPNKTTNREDRRKAGITNVTTMLDALDFDTSATGKNAKTMAMVNGLTVPQLRSLAQGLASGMTDALYRKYRTDANEAKAAARVVDKAKAWKEDYRGENPWQMISDAREEMKGMERSTDWQFWKGIAAKINRAVELNVAAVSEAADEQKEKDKALHEQITDGMDAAYDKDPRIRQKWHLAMVDFLANPVSTFNRMGPIVRDLFYDRIKAGVNAASALMQRQADAFMDDLVGILKLKSRHGKDMRRYMNSAALDERDITIHGRTVRLTSDQITQQRVIPSQRR